MRKTLLIAALLVSFASYSQKHGFVSTFGGLGIPLSDYRLGGYAALGTNFGIEGGYYFNKSIGIGLRVASTSNNFDTYYYFADFKRDLKSLGVDYTYLSAEAGKWSLLNFGLGIYSTINISEKFKIETKGVFGLLSVKSPYIDVSVETDDFDMTLYQESSSVTSFQYNADIGFKYFISEEFSINIYGGLIGANPYFSSKIETTIDGDKSYDIDRYYQRILLINTGIGLTYILK